MHIQIRTLAFHYHAYLQLPTKNKKDFPISFSQHISYRKLTVTVPPQLGGMFI